PRNSSAVPRADGNQFCGVEPHTGEGGAGGNGFAGGGVAFATGRAAGGESGAHSRRAGVAGSGRESACCRRELSGFSRKRRRSIRKKIFNYFESSKRGSTREKYARPSRMAGQRAVGALMRG